MDEWSDSCTFYLPKNICVIVDSTTACNQKPLPPQLQADLKELIAAENAFYSAGQHIKTVYEYETGGGSTNNSAETIAVTIENLEKSKHKLIEAIGAIFNTSERARSATESFHQEIKQHLAIGFKIRTIRIGQGDCMWVNKENVDQLIIYHPNPLSNSSATL